MSDVEKASQVAWEADRKLEDAQLRLHDARTKRAELDGLVETLEREVSDLAQRANFAHYHLGMARGENPKHPDWVGDDA